MSNNNLNETWYDFFSDKFNNIFPELFSRLLRNLNPINFSEPFVTAIKVCIHLYLIYLIVYGLFFKTIKDDEDNEDNKTQDESSNQGNKVVGLTMFSIISYILYIFFIQTMYVKMVCGKHTSIIEIVKNINFMFKYGKYNFISGEDKYKEIKEKLKKETCFKYYNTNLNKNSNFIYNNVESIQNLNSNFNTKLFDKRGNPNHKYLSINLHLFLIILYQQFINLLDKNSSFTYGQTLISIILVNLFFIWTCVLNLPIWVIILLMITAILSYFIYSLYDVYTTIKSNPSKEYDDSFLCQPHIIPIVNKIWAPKTFSENLNYCLNEKGNHFFLKMMKPYITSINNVESEITDQKSKLNNLSGIVSVFEDRLERIANNLYQKIQSIINKIVQIKNKIYDIFKNIFQIFTAIIISIVNILYSMNSIKKILDGIPSFLGGCFEENTLLLLENNKEIKIKDIRVGDKLFDGSKVIGTLKIKYVNQQMYKFKNIIVSGDHYIMYNNKQILINMCEESELLNSLELDYIYCLITDSGKININEHIFMDYFDTENLDIQHQIQNNIVSKLNHLENPMIATDSYYMPLWGFSPNTIVTMKNNLTKQFTEIQIGDETLDGIVYSIIKFIPNNVYKYNNILTTGDQIVKKDDIWYKVKDLEESIKIENNTEIFYNIITSDNRINIHNIEFTDFEQIPNYGYTEYIN